MTRSVVNRVLRILNLTSYRQMESVRQQLNAEIESLRQECEQLLIGKSLLENSLYWSNCSRQISPQTLLSDPSTNIKHLIEILEERLGAAQEFVPVAVLLLELYMRYNDGILNFILSVYRQSIESGNAYWDVRKSVHVVSNVLKPKTYLEIGTRTGWSLAQVFRTTPDVHAFAFDLWIEGFKGHQGSIEFVRSKMQEAVGSDKTPHIDFISGNSHDALPDFFAGKLDVKPPPEFDIIVVDGDHSALGAWWDLTDVVPHVRIGGALIFDDIELTDEVGHEYTTTVHPRPDAPPNMRNLVDVWRTFQEHYPNFHYFNCETYSARAGVAIRMS